MCTVSMVGDHYRDMWRKEPWWPNQMPNDRIPYEKIAPTIQLVSLEEFNQLKRQVEEMKALLERALKYDEDNNEPHCETDEKMILLQKIAEAVGIDLKDLNLNEQK